MNKTASYIFNVSDPGDTFNISISNPVLTLNTTDTGLGNEISWLLMRSDDTVSFQITVLDSVGASSILQPIITYCGCENSQPCLPLPVDADGGSSRFISLQCNCSQGKYVILYDITDALIINILHVNKEGWHNIKKTLVLCCFHFWYQFSLLLSRV